ncbi:MAG TPA: STAS domain-containing protein [Gaiellales bacterium]|jgi:anti-sigma B factor antagonist|nr:STAS domain-containing protein [Gaiellales bacterium]
MDEARPRFTQEMVDEKATVVRVEGELDIDSADALRDALDEAEASVQTVLRLDASGVSFLDSTALGVILASAQRMEERGARFELVCTSPSIRRILDMTLISRTVHVLP